MYSLTQLKKGIKHPKLIYTELKDIIWKMHSKTSTKVYNIFYPPIPEQDWDNLIILDACRYDLFEQENTLPGTLKEYYSNGSNTAEYVKKTFKGEKYQDMVLVTSTPKYYKPNVEDSFFEVIHVWDGDWDKENRTVLPETMNEYVLKAAEQYPNKRILAHYIPPHQPFIGETGKSMPHQIQFSGGVIKQGMDEPNVWGALKRGEYERDTVWQAYRENLQLTLPYIEEMLNQLKGKTVVTSDHGNVFGKISELGITGHPQHRHIKPLIKVPWLEYENGERREISEEKNENRKGDVDEEKVKNRLEALGYGD